MSRILGEGDKAVLVAGGLDAPEAVSRRRAVRHLLHGIYLYGRDGALFEKGPCRGWRGDIYEALRELHPEAAAHLDKHQDSTATWKKYGADPAMGDEIDAEEVSP